MEPIRYTPGEAIRWLETGASDLRKDAKRKSNAVWDRTGERNFGTDIKDAAGALLDLGKSALAELAHRQALASQFLLFPDRFEVVNSAGIRHVPYSEVTSIRQKGDKVTVVLRKGSVTIKPHAYILCGKLKIPLGWARNGIEVPFETLLDEISARAGHEIDHL